MKKSRFNVTLKQTGVIVDGDYGGDFCYHDEQTFVRNGPAGLAAAASRQGVMISVPIASRSENTPA